MSSILVSYYRADIRPAIEGLPDQVRQIVDSGAGAALGVADSFGPDGENLANAVREASAQGLSASMWFGAIILGVAAVGTAIVAPRSVTSKEVIDAQEQEISS